MVGVLTEVFFSLDLICNSDMRNTETSENEEFEAMYLDLDDPLGQSSHEHEVSDIVLPNCNID
jgi:hypothetical protein